MNFKIRTKILGINLFIIVIFLIFSIFIVFKINELGEIQDEGAIRNEHLTSIMEIQSNFNNIYGFCADAIINNEVNELKSIHSKMDNILNHDIELLTPILDHKEEKEKLEIYKSNFMNYKSEIQSLYYELTNANDFNKVKSIDKNIDVAKNIGKEALSFLVERLHIETKEGDKEFDKIRANLTTTIIIILILALFISIIASIIISNSISKPINKLVVMANNIADGNLKF
jgi:methyl-accepting chemotaxis protein